MDTRKTLLTKNIKGFPNSVELSDISEEVQRFLEGYVSFGEHLQDVYQLFKLLEFNLSQLFNYCTMSYDDRLVKFDGETVDFYDINGLVINVISSAKTLVEALENFYQTELGENRKNEFKKEVLSKKYDEVFSYRFLLFMRNFAQHGHLLISHAYDESHFCFDLSQILSTQHIKFGSAIKESMEKVHDEIVDRFQDMPRIAVTYTLDSFITIVCEIYYEFLQSIEGDVKEKCNRHQHYLDIYPELIYRGDDILNGYVIYKIDEDGEAHIYKPEGSLFNGYTEYKKEAENTYLKYKAEHMEPKFIE